MSAVIDVRVGAVVGSVVWGALAIAAYRGSLVAPEWFGHLAEIIALGNAVVLVFATIVRHTGGFK